MIELFHVTCSQGRADTFYLEATSKSKILNLLKTASTAVVRNIKQVVYSKTWNINYNGLNEKEHVPQLTYHRVVVFALSQNYAQTFELFNIKRSVTKEMIMQQFKKLLINNEPIIDFVDISFYDEGVSPISYDNLYQLQYKRNSKTYVENFYAKSYQEVKEMAELLFDGELLEIRKFVHHDDTVIDDDSSKYTKRVALLVNNQYGTFKSFLPKIKKSVHDRQLEQLCNDNLLFNGKKLTSLEEIRLIFN